MRLELELSQQQGTKRDKEMIEMTTYGIDFQDFSDKALEVMLPLARKAGEVDLANDIEAELDRREGERLAEYADEWEDREFDLGD